MNRFASPSLLAAAGLAALALAGCKPAPEPKAAAVEPLPMGVTINAMMVGTLDFAADGIWRPAALKTKLTDADWLLAQEDATTLVAATSLMTIPTAGGARDAAFIADPQWRQWTEALQASGLKALEAAKAHDQTALKEAGDEAVELCQACHTRFKPGMPGGGITRYPEYPKPPRT